MSKKNDSMINILTIHNDILNLHLREATRPLNRKLLTKTHKPVAAKAVVLDEIVSVLAKVPWVSLVCTSSYCRTCLRNSD